MSSRKDRTGKPGSAEEPAGQRPELKEERTPGDGTLDGTTPAGQTVDQLRRRAEDTDHRGEPGTG